MRLPNGYGSVYKLSGNRRKPWVARKTIGFNEKAYPIYKIIGYYSSKANALEALVEYNKDPFDLDTVKMTFTDVFKDFYEEKSKKISNA